jgi:GNAT superfamily N-acetyltransferase
MTPAPEDYVVSTATETVDVDFVCTALAGSYWAQQRPRDVIEASLRNSLCFGVYERGSHRQVGFARVVTDGATFSWVCDVIIDEGHRKKGLGKLLMASVIGDARLQGTMFLLGTRDAHGLYEKFGFVRNETMRRMPPPAMPQQPPDPAPAPASP